MRKAILVDIDHKKNSQLEISLSLSAKERLEYLIELISLSQKFQSTNKEHDPMGNTFILSRKNNVSV